MNRATPPPKLVYRMPFLLTVTMGAYALIAGFAGSSILLAPLGFNLMTYQVNGQAVNGMEFVRQTAPVLVPLGALATAISYALWTERLWGREALIGGQLIIAAAGYFWALWQYDVDVAINTVVYPVVGLIFFVWYLYRKGSVRAYYAALASSTASAADETESLGQDV